MAKMRTVSVAGHDGHRSSETTTGAITANCDASRVDVQQAGVLAHPLDHRICILELCREPEQHRRLGCEIRIGWRAGKRHDRMYAYLNSGAKRYSGEITTQPT